MKYHVDHIVRYINIESQCCTPEMNKILHLSYTSIKKFFLKREMHSPYDSQ